jgi:predicted nucleic acid-binding protein
MAPQSRMRKSICFDTGPMIWGVRGDADEGREDMIERSRVYIQHLQEHGYAIMVPPPVISEYLGGSTKTQFDEARILRRGFMIPVFDTEVAVMAARLFNRDKFEEIKNETGTSKRCLKIDCLIIATAIVNNAERIITDNLREFTSIAEGHIKVDPVPILPKQTIINFDEPGSAEPKS